MPTAKTHERPNRRHTHKANGPDAATERCPWCGSKISRVEFQRIRDQIAEQERGRLAKAEQALRKQLASERSHRVSTTALRKRSMKPLRCSASGSGRQLSASRRDRRRDPRLPAHDP
jgi:hypothetical protein